MPSEPRSRTVSSMADLPDLRVSGVAQESFVDGPGVRYTLFLQGCLHGCPGCHNPGTHDPLGGFVKSGCAVLSEVGENRLLDGVTFSGGEPFLQAGVLVPLARQLRAAGYHLMAYSGFTWDRLLADPGKRRLLEVLDILVDGPYLQKERSLGLLWRGSKNQRVIDVQASLLQEGGSPVLLVE